MTRRQEPARPQPDTTDTSGRTANRAGTERLSREQWWILLVLGLPAFGIALAYTTVSTYLPVLLSELSGPAVTGVLIGGEGLVGLLIPLLVGGWSDKLRSGLGGRLPFVLVGGALAVAGLLVMPLASESLLMVAVGLGIFFVGYFVYHTPYYALFPDLVPQQARGRSQGVQGALRSGGMLLGLAGGGFLLSFWQPLPFVFGAVAVVAVTAGLYFGMRGRLKSAGGDRDGSHRRALTAHWELVRGDRAIRNWVIADALWEAAVAAMRTFVVLYLTRGLGLSLRGAAITLALVGLAALIAAPVAGKLADRYGPRPVMLVAVIGFAVGLTPALVTTNLTFIAATVPVAFAAVVLLTLPYTLLMGLLPAREHGAGASLLAFGHAAGVLGGPLLAGLAIEFLRPVDFLAIGATQGYAAAFAVAMVLLLASVPVLRRIEDRQAAT